MKQVLFHCWMLVLQTEGLHHTLSKSCIALTKADTEQDMMPCLGEQGLHSACKFMQAGVPASPRKSVHPQHQLCVAIRDPENAAQQMLHKFSLPPLSQI